MIKSLKNQQIWLNASFFLWAMISPLQDIPKVNVFGFSTRPGYVVLIPFFTILLIQFKTFFQNLFTNKVSKILFALIVFNIINDLLLGNLNNRAIGFILWLSINTAIITFINSNNKFSMTVLNGYIFGQSLNAIYQILIFFFYPKIWAPESIQNFLFNGSLRSFGLSGEPSYFAVSILPLVAYLYLSKHRYKYQLLCLFSFSLMLSLSRLSYLGLFLLPIIFFFNKKNIVKNFKSYLIITTCSLIFNMMANPSYFFKPKNLDSANSTQKIDKTLPLEVQKKAFQTDIPLIDNGWNSQRIRSFKRGAILFSEHPITGVGLGNSHQSLIKRFLNTAPEHYYVEGVHNLYLEILLEQGIIGIFIFIMLLITLIKLSSRLDLLLPFLFLLFVPMQFAQTITIPTIWVFAILALSKTEENF